MRDNIFVLRTKRHRSIFSMDVTRRHMPLSAVGRRYGIVLNANWRWTCRSHFVWLRKAPCPARGEGNRLQVATSEGITQKGRIWRVMTMGYNTRNCWLSGLRASSGVPNTRKHNVLDLFPPLGYGGGAPTLLGPLERANFNHWIWIQFPKRCVFLYLEFRTMDKDQKPSNSDSEGYLRWNLRVAEWFSAALSNAARYTFLAPSVSTLFEPIININSNFRTKNIFKCLSTVKYFHKISLKHGTVL
jgi:hypothetical protein